MTPSLRTHLSPDGTGRLVTRRELLTSIGGAAAASSLRRSTDTQAVADSPLHIRVYPGPVSLRAWISHGFDGVHQDWPPPFRDAVSAVEGALEQILSYAHDRSRLEGLEARVERGELVRFPLSATPLSSEAVVPTLETVLDVFRAQLRARNALTGSACHLLLCWSPFNYRLGYGGTLSPNALVGNDAAGTTGDATTVANLGATELWDSRAVTRNMAIHELLHTILSSDVAEGVGGSRCDHDLGTAVRIDDDTMRVSPMATAYAGPDEIGGGTRWQGRGCANHDSFHRHDGFDGVEHWTYTTDLSEATLEAVTRSLERLVFQQP
ncbi:hypothetical protein [Natronorubrum thiooxidans]|uniref:Uncharacterized protein n=1 Tax=Natronorubrum thiooxidans TaxID=308853 RepID=A0A1N7GRP2_9EURY|nr:hypothetical protein [Natronorubrum thiooxidans]SIS15234.1 hypothetical protein SAMN05421752_114121 [Natronorubrum thiooxidans]